MEYLKEVKETVAAIVPKEAEVSSVDLEGPEIAIYTKNPRAFHENEDYVRAIAHQLKKKVNIRADKSLLLEEKEAREKIMKIVPEDAKIADIQFMEAFSEVVIEALKPGLVIGKGGMTTKEIILQTGWTPKILRSPTSPSEILRGIRHHLVKYASERKKILQETAKKIYSEKPGPSWIRLTPLGGFRQVGRSCIMLETRRTKILMDCGINVAAQNSEDAFPYLDAIRFPINELDAVVISHTHMDHIGFLPYLFKLGYRGPVYMSVDYAEPVMIKENGRIKIEKIGAVIDKIIGNSKNVDFYPENEYMAAQPNQELYVPAFSKDKKINFKKVKKVIRHKVEGKIFEIVTRNKRKVKVTGSHSVFVLKNGKISDAKVSELKIGDYLIAPHKLPSGNEKIETIGLEQYNGKGSKIKLPGKISVNTDLMKILGYFTAEGHFEKRGIRLTFGLKDRGIVEELKNAVRKVFDIEAKDSISQETRLRVAINSKNLLDVFKKEFFPGYKKATSKRIPEIVFNVGDELKLAFLEAYFEGDGTINQLNKTATATTVSKDLASDLSYLCSQLGFTYSKFTIAMPKAKTKNTVYSITINLSEFFGKRRLDKKGCDILPLKEVGFGQEWFYHRLKNRKHVTKQRLAELLNKNWVKSANGTSLVAQETREKLMEFSETDLAFLPITEINMVEPTNGFVYDFSVEDDQNFVGGEAPICLHNTEPTRDLGALLLFDYLDIMAKENKEAPYSERDVKEMLKYCITRDYREVTDIAPDMRLTFHNAAHVLGSASVHLHIGEGAHNLVYSADIKYGFSRLFNNVDINYPRLETLIVESTYGGKDDIQTAREDTEARFLKIIQETVNQGGSILVPVFAVGRAQEIQLVIENYYRKGLIDPEVKVYIDGMTKESSAIHTAYPEYLRTGVQKRVLQNDSPFTSDIFQVAKPEDRDAIAQNGKAIILASSGMLTGGASVQYFYRLAENPVNTLAFVGYQGEGSLGRKVLSGVKSLPITDNAGRTRKLNVNLRIERLDGFSGHSDRMQLSAYVRNLKPKPKRILTDHGEAEKCVELAKHFSQKFGISSQAIRNLDSVRLK